LRGKQNYTLELSIFCPQAGLALPFPNDEKEAKILSKRTLGRAFWRPSHSRWSMAYSNSKANSQFYFFVIACSAGVLPPKEKKR